jgi:hypothetical protein
LRLADTKRTARQAALELPLAQLAILPSASASFGVKLSRLIVA